MNATREARESGASGRRGSTPQGRASATRGRAAEARAGGQPDPTAPSADPAAANDPVEWIAVAAYYRAERRGFAPGGEVEDWLAAESEIRQSTARTGRAGKGD